MPLSCRCFKIAIASAAPSVGSVPAPSSSKIHRECSSALSNMEMVFVMCAENVERFCSMLCSSPISAYTSVNTPSSERSSAGMCSPDCPISVKSPTVFRETVFPPVFGPVTIKRSKSAPKWTSIGTTVFLFNNGCLPLRISMYRLLLNNGRDAFISIASAARAKIKSKIVKRR